MSSLQAALGLAQLERLSTLVERKRELFSWYRETLRPVDGIVLNAEPAGTLNSYWMTTALFDPAFEMSKRDIMDRLDAEGIDTRPFFYPLSSLEAYAGSSQAELARSRNLVSYDISPRGVNLPSGLNLTREDVKRVCAALISTLEGRRRR
jgi:perosamine synthetase